MNKTIKKIVALGMGASMLAGTAAIALATDLSNYPAPFVKDGAFVGKIVIGEKAASIDTIGALDIAASLQRAASTKVASTGTSTTVSSGVRLDTSGDRIYYNEPFGVDSASKTDLDILKANQFEDDEGTVYDYTQSVVFKKANGAYNNLSFGQHGESDIDSFLAFDLSTSVSSSNYLYVSKVDFTKVLNTTDANVIGNKITLFGNEYTFSSETTSSKIVLYGSAEEVSVTPKDEVTKSVDGKDYSVKVIGFSSTGTKVTVSVNGVTDALNEGSSKTIGGLKIYAKTVSSWNNGIDGFATLQLGANKIVLEDGQSVQVGASEDSIDGTLVDIVGTPGAVSSIYVYVNAQDSDADFLKQGSEFKDPVFGTFKITYTGNNFDLMDSSRDMIELKESGSNRVYAKLPGADDVYFNYNGALSWDSGKTIYPWEGAAAAEDTYVYLAPADAKYTHLVKVKNIRAHATEGYVQFEDALSGATYETQQGVFNTTGHTLTLTVDGKDYTVAMTADGATPTVSATYSDSYTVVYPEIELKSGETFALLASISPSGITNATTLLFPGSLNGVSKSPGTAAAYFIVAGAVGEVTYNITNSSATAVGTISPSSYAQPTFFMKEERDYGSNYEVILVPTTSGTTKISVPAFTGVSGSGSMENDDTTAYVDYFGTYVTRYNPTGDNDVSLKIYYPGEQMYANVFIAPLAAVASTSGGASGAVVLSPIAVGIAITDTEAKLDGKTSYIVVGGPCANTVAFDLMNKPTDCAAGFTEGKATIKLFSEQNALLVAGGSGKDTQGASRVLAEYGTYKSYFVGTELEVVDRKSVV